MVVGSMRMVHGYVFIETQQAAFATLSTSLHTGPGGELEIVFELHSPL